MDGEYSISVTSKPERDTPDEKELSSSDHDACNCGVCLKVVFTKIKEY
ncbi:MAG: hypothetical protein Q8K60_08615 [Parachlamydiaceae bacterium]|nr:hypothetical protein [Parachlamydiaceae bacterium]